MQIQMTSHGGPEVLTLVEAPRPIPGHDEVLIEVHAAGLNRPDLLQRQGLYPPPIGASPILGLEVAGKVVSSPSHSKIRPGDMVCALVHGGGYSEYCVAPVSQCLPVPRGLSLEEAAGIPETYFTVWANVFHIGRLKTSDKFLVHGGTSGIGTTAIQLARAFGAEVYATAGDERKTKVCEELGAKIAINYRTQSFVERVKEVTSGSGVDIILDMVGGSYTEKNIECLAVEGRLVQIGTQQGSTVSLSLMKMMQKRLTITGSTLRPRSIEDKAKIASELFQHVWPLFEQKKIRIVLDKIFTLKEASEAHHYLDSGKSIGKVILKVK